MKRTALTALAAAALISGPAIAQQAPNTNPAPGESFLTTWDLDEDGKVTLQELQSRRSDIFLSFDGDEDGFLSAEEYDVLDAARMDGMQRPADRGQGLGRGEQALRREAVDANADGSVSAEEYAAGAETWLRVMDGNGDGVLTIDDFGPGARQAGMGQGQGQGQGRGNGQGMGQGRGNGQGMGQGMGQGNVQGQGPGQGLRQDSFGKGGGYGQGQNAGRGGAQGRDMMQGRGQGGQRMHHGDMQRGGMGQGMGQRQADRPAAYGAFPTPDGGLWIVDSRTGDILFCRASVDGDAPAGFTPVCVEARK